jgi:hypothetical protein
MTSKGEVQRLLRCFRAAGWVVWYSRSGHWRARAPDGRTLTLAGTPNTFGLRRDRAKVAKALGEDRAVSIVGEDQ